MMTDIAVERQQAGPVTLDRDEIDVLLGDQAPRQAIAPDVELVRAMRGLAEQDHTRPAGGIDQRTQVCGTAQWRFQRSQGAQQLVGAGSTGRYAGQQHQQGDHQHGAERDHHRNTVFTGR